MINIDSIRYGTDDEYRKLINRMILVATRDEILMELQKMWGEQWAITLDVVGGRPDVFDIYPKGYIQRSNELVRTLNRMG